MKTLVTGATGMIGWNIVKKLVESGRDVSALVRNPDKAKSLLPAQCKLIKGDVTDENSIKSAIAGMEVVYHCAGLPEQWLPSEDTFDIVNVQGTNSMCAASMAAGVKKFIYTSTIDVFKGEAGKTYDESVLDDVPKKTAYERSKQKADEVVVEWMKKGLHAVFLHPSGLYGPGPATSPLLNDFVIKLKQKKVPMILPGAVPLVYSEDVADGHLLAESKAATGARYILTGSFHEFSELTLRICEKLGIKKVPRVMPLWVARTVSFIGEAISSMTGKPPLIPSGQLTFMQWRAEPRSDRAKKELGWKPLDFSTGMDRTVMYLRQQNRL